MSKNKINNINNEDQNDFWNDIEDSTELATPSFNLTFKQKNSNSVTKQNKYHKHKCYSDEKQKSNKKGLSRINNMIALRKMKEKQNELEFEKLKKEKEDEDLRECTFNPKINKKYQVNTNNKYTSTINTESFYERNIKWKQNIKGKVARLSQIKEINKCDYSYKPNIGEQVDYDKIFNDKEIFSYWVRNNRVYLNRHLNKIKLNTKKSNTSTITNKAKPLNSIIQKNYKSRNKNNNISINWISKKNNALFRSIDILHKELQNTVVEEDDDNYYNYSL